MNVKSLRAPGRDLHIHDLVGSRKNHPQLFPGYRLDSIQLAKCCDLDPENPAFLGQNPALSPEASDFVTDSHHLQMRPRQGKSADCQYTDAGGDPGDGKLKLPPGFRTLAAP